MKSLLEFLQSQLPWLAISWSRSIRFLLLCQSFQHRVYTSEEKQKELFNIEGLTKVLHNAWQKESLHGRVGKHGWGHSLVPCLLPATNSG